MTFESIFSRSLTGLAELSLLSAIIWKLTIILGVAWCGHFLLRRANPRWRVLLWRTVTVTMLVIPLCHFVIPPMQFQPVESYAADPGTVPVVPEQNDETSEAGGVPQADNSTSGVDFFAHRSSLRPRTTSS